MTVTAILSDIHDGHVVSHTDAVLRFVRTGRFDRLIVAGDLTDADGSPNPRLLDALGRVALLRELWVLPGNHDPHAGLVARAIGARTDAFHVWCEGGRRVCVTHGHVDPFSGKPFDPYLRGYLSPTSLGNQLESDLTFYAGPLGRWLALAGHRLRRRLCDVRASVRDGCLDLAARKAFDWMVVGHVHYACEEPPKGGRAGYVNCGSWCQDVNTYVVVENGQAKLHEFK